MHVSLFAETHCPPLSNVSRGGGAQVGPTSRPVRRVRHGMQRIGFGPSLLLWV